MSAIFVILTHQYAIFLRVKQCTSESKCQKIALNEYFWIFTIENSLLTKLTLIGIAYKRGLTAILNAAVGKSTAQWILVRNRQTKPNPSTYILDLKAWEKPMSKGHFSAAASHFLICLFLLYSKVNLEIQGRGIYLKKVFLAFLKESLLFVSCF